MNKYRLLALHIISLVLLWFGLVLNMLKITITANVFIDITLLNESRSVLGTLQSLWRSANYFPFLLILFFGIVIPVTKSIILFYILLARNANPVWYKLVFVSSKWAMADVFAISILIAFLSARAMQSTQARLEPGFYFFTGYVLLSAVITFFYKNE